MTTCRPAPATFKPDEIEVFKTNIDSATVGRVVVRALQKHLPVRRVVLDLDDCDRILWVAAPPGEPEVWARVVALVHCLGVEIEALPD